MHHEYLDKYSRMDSIIHRISPKIKFIFCIVGIFIISFTGYLPISILMSIIFLAIIFSRVPILFFIERLMLCFPFLIFLFFLPTDTALLLLSRALSSIITITLLMSTTTFTKLIEVLRWIKVPSIFIMMFSFFYRYIFTIVDTMHRMKHAQESRTFTRKQKMDPKTTSKMIGNLFVRSFDQSERIYMAMLARGYDPDDRD